MIKLPVMQDAQIRQAFSQIEKNDMRTYKRGENIEVGQNSIILTAPNGTRYKLVVSNAGALSTVAV